MRFQELDTLECHCGSRALSIERAAIISAAAAQRVDGVQCHEWCARKQRRPSEGGVSPTDCRECHTENIDSGTIVCVCGRTWVVRDGAPVFSAHTVTETADRNARIVETDFATDPRWNPFVRNHPDGSIYHHSLWLESLRREYSQQTLSLACEDGSGHLTGIFPMMYTRGMPFGITRIGDQVTGRRLASLPRTPIAGPLALDSQAATMLLAEAIRRARQEPGIQLQIKTYAADLGAIAPELVCVPWRFSYVLELPPSDAPLRIANPNHRRSMKSALNMTAKNGVTVRLADSQADLRQWYMLYLETLRRNVVPPRPYRFFTTLWEAFSGTNMMQLLIAEKPGGGNDRIHAGSIFFTFATRVNYGFNASRRSDFHLRSNEIMLWRAINEAHGNHAAHFDLGEVPDGDRHQAHFKSKWGAEPVQLYRYYFPAPRGANTGKTHHPGTARRVLDSVWRRTPLPVTAVIGDYMYGYL